MLDKKVFRRVVDEYLLTGRLKDGANLYEQMDVAQRYWFQTTKRAFQRIRPKKELRIRK